MLNNLYNYRFHIFLVSQLTILFGALIFSQDIFNTTISPLLNIGNLLAGLLLLYKKKRTFWLVGVILLLATLSFISIEITTKDELTFFNGLRLVSYFVFHLVVTKELILQVWKTKRIGEKIILGLISGYISLGFLGFFMCLSTEFSNPGSFSFPDNGISMIQNLMYFSYVTLLTVGYGEIIPVTVLAQKVALFIGLTGQMYLVVLTGIVVGKYINQKESDK